MIDLHTHTTESDGTLSPVELLQLANTIGVEALAVTDHDTFAGHDQAALVKNAGLDLVRGIELSTRYKSRSVHLLAYFIKGQPPEGFSDWVAGLQASRKARNQELVAALQAKGIDITMAEVVQHGKKLPGRPHFAVLLLKKKYVTSIQRAFDEYLGESGVCYIPRDEPSLEEAVARIAAAGGLSSLAHPGRISRDPGVIEEYVRDMHKIGLHAIEAYHSEHHVRDVLLYTELASRYSLAITGGSDFHGEAKPLIALGTGCGHNLDINRSVLERLRLLA